MGEGEYVNIQYGYQLMQNISTNAIKIAGGLQPTANPKTSFDKFPNVNYFICGESEFVLCEIANKIKNKELITEVNGIVF